MAKIRTSTGWLAKETIKGFLEAGEKVGGIIGKSAGKRIGNIKGGEEVGKLAGKTIGKIMKAPFSVGKKIVERVGKEPFQPSEEEIKRRKKILERPARKKEWEEKFPGKPFPKEF